MGVVSSWLRRIVGLNPDDRPGAKGPIDTPFVREMRTIREQAEREWHEYRPTGNPVEDGVMENLKRWKGEGR